MPLTLNSFPEDPNWELNWLTHSNQEDIYLEYGNEPPDIEADPNSWPQDLYNNNYPL